MIGRFLAAGIVGLLLVGTESICCEDSVLHPPAGACIDPIALLVTGPCDDVAAVASRFDGWANHTQEGMRTVYLPVPDVDQLDRLKAALEQVGLDVQYFFTYQLN